MKKNFEILRSKMTPERRARADECARKMLDEILMEGLESGNPVQVNDAYWANLRRRVADKAGENVSAYGGLKNEISPGTKAQERQVARDTRIKKYTNPQ